MMLQSEFDAANVALSRAADKRKSLINIHKNRYTATSTPGNTLRDVGVRVRSITVETRNNA